MDTEELQKQIRVLQKRLNWTDSELAEALYIGLNEDDDSVKILKFKEVMRKHLRRNTTPAQKLEQYLGIIKEHPSFEELDIVYDSYTKMDQLLSKKILVGMKRISKDLDQHLQDRECFSDGDEGLDL